MRNIADPTDPRQPPKWPTLFVKGKHALADPEDAVPIPKMCQDETCVASRVDSADVHSLDWEGELAFVISKDCKNVPETGDDWKSYVAGYTCADDVTWRFGQKVRLLI